MTEKDLTKSWFENNPFSGEAGRFEDLVEDILNAARMDSKIDVDALESYMTDEWEKDENGEEYIPEAFQSREVPSSVNLTESKMKMITFIIARNNSLKYMKSTAMNIIMTRCSPTFASIWRKFKLDARKSYKYLKDTYGEKAAGVSDRTSYIDGLINIRFVAPASFSSFLVDFERMCDNVHLDKDNKLAWMMRQGILPEHLLDTKKRIIDENKSYDESCRMLERSDNTWRISKCTEALAWINAPMQIIPKSELKIQAIQHDSESQHRNNYFSNNNHYDSKLECYHCGRKGHKAFNCPMVEMKSDTQDPKLKRKSDLKAAMGKPRKFIRFKSKVIGKVNQILGEYGDGNFDVSSDSDDSDEEFEERGEDPGNSISSHVNRVYAGSDT